MDDRQIAVIALSNRDFPNLEEKMAEAAGWVEFAAGNGAHLAVLPELLNRYCGDGAGNPKAIPAQELAFDDWQDKCSLVLEAAVRKSIDVVVPVLRREAEGSLINCFFLVSGQGSVIGEYQKRFPTPQELSIGVRPGATQPFDWRGVRVGGAICFDTLFPEVFADQAAHGAEFFIVPSLWPGGGQLSSYAVEHSAPIALAYPAWSRIIDVDGQEVAAAGYRSETLRFGFGSPVAMATINFDQVALFGNHNQQKMVEVQRKYGERVRVRFVQQDVLFVLESRCAGLPVAEVVREFELIPQKEYLRHCRELVAAAA